MLRLWPVQEDGIYMNAWLLRGLILVAILGLPKSTALGQTAPFCALRISVQAQDGSPVHAALVDLIDPSQKVVQSRKVSNGWVEFCDFGFGYHSIRVRSDQPLEDVCETMVRDVKVIYGRSQRMNVILNQLLCNV
jgi:hypothetical protein